MDELEFRVLTDHTDTQLRALWDTLTGAHGAWVFTDLDHWTRVSTAVSTLTDVVRTEVLCRKADRSTIVDLGILPPVDRVMGGHVIHGPITGNPNQDALIRLGLGHLDAAP